LQAGKVSLAAPLAAATGILARTSIVFVVSEKPAAEYTRVSQENKTSLTLSLGILQATRLKEGSGLYYFMLSPTVQLHLEEGNRTVFIFHKSSFSASSSYRNS
jgi:hypothetical protein